MNNSAYKNLKDFFDKKVEQYNQPSFIKDDPISIPHLFSKKQDIEIAGFFAAIFAWGNRTTIINKSKELMQYMDMSPHEYCLNAGGKALKRLSDFKHRTFNTTDLLYFIEFLKHHYTHYNSLEIAFTKWGNNIEQMLALFENRYEDSVVFKEWDSMVVKGNLYTDRVLPGLDRIISMSIVECTPASDNPPMRKDETLKEQNQSH